MSVTTEADEVRDFFDRQQSGNQYESLKAMTSALDIEAARSLNQQASGDVLSIGGIWDHFTWGEQLRALTVLDLSPEMLEAYCPVGAIGVVGDLYTYEFASGSFDTIVFPLMLHHTPVGNWRSCEARITDAVDRAQGWLRPSGKLIILEYCPHPAWLPVQRGLLPLTRRFLAAFGQPMVVMYGRSFYEEVLSHRFGTVRVDRVETDEFDDSKWYPIFMAIRWLKMPLKMYPKLHIITAPRQLRRQS